MILDRSKIKAGVVLAQQFKGTYYECRVIVTGLQDQLGFVLADGRVFRSISEASTVCRGGIRSNGYRDWHIKDEFGEGTGGVVRSKRSKISTALTATFKATAAAARVARAEQLRYERAAKSTRNAAAKLRDSKVRKYGGSGHPGLRESRKGVGFPLGIINPERVLLKLKVDDVANAGVAEGWVRLICTACVDYYDFPDGIEPAHCAFGHPAIRELSDRYYYDGEGRGDKTAAEFSREFWSTEEALSYALNGKDVDVSGTEVNGSSDEWEEKK